MADFLRRRREALQPADVGLPKGPRRRTSGLRREEVAALSGMSADYYTRLEQRRGPQPSEPMLAAIARGLRLSADERDHLFRLAGHGTPTRVARSGHVSPALLRVLDRLEDTPAMVLSDLGETLAQNRLAAALLGDHSGYEGLARSSIYRWFTHPAERAIYPGGYHDQYAREIVANLRAAASRNGRDARVAELVRELSARSVEFARLWERHEVGLKPARRKVIVHPELGGIELDCQFLFTDDLAQALLVFTATPGTEDYDRLALLGVIGQLAGR